MTRPIPEEFTDAVYHGVVRGSEHKPIVRDERDRTGSGSWRGLQRLKDAAKPDLALATRLEQLAGKMARVKS